MPKPLRFLFLLYLSRLPVLAQPIASIQSPNRQLTLQVQSALPASLPTG